MSPLLALTLLVATLAVGVAGLWQVAKGSAENRAVVGQVDQRYRGGVRGLLSGSLDRRFRRTRPGRQLQLRLARAQLDAITPSEGLAIAVVVAVTVTALSTTLVATWMALLLGGVSVVALRQVLTWREERQRRAFVAQMPELARVLSNATSAGLSIRTAIEMAGAELADPAKSELQRCARSMAVGASLEQALQQMEERLPGRELSVLVGTLIISSRSGGSLIAALRDIAHTLDDRKELKREVRTLMTQASYTGYLVAAMGVGLLFLLNSVQPGLLHKLTSSLLGIGALSFAVVCFGSGVLIIRRMTRVDL